MMLHNVVFLVSRQNWTLVHLLALQRDAGYIYLVTAPLLALEED